MSFIDDMFDEWMMQDALGFHDDEEREFDDTFIRAQRQEPLYPGGIDWRYERGGALYEE